MKIDATTIQKYMSPDAYKDLDRFLEELPLRAGQSAVLAGAFAWLMAGLSILYVFMQANHILELRADILKAEALKPTVPVISQKLVPAAEVNEFAKKLAAFYPQLTIIGGSGRLELRAPSTGRYGVFREAVGHSFNGGKGWRLSLESLCVGRECKERTPVMGAFKVYRLQVDKNSG